MSADQFECEKTKRECLVTANCDADKRDACESAFRSCSEPVKQEHDKLHDTCRTQRETCEAAATDDQGRHDCHIAELKCTLPVEPPEASCHIDAEECRWNAGDKMLPPPPPPAAGAMAPPPPRADGMKPPPPPDDNPALQACRETEKTCVDSKRMKPEDLPKPPMCGPAGPPKCNDGMMPPPPPPADMPLPLPDDMTSDHVACERTKRECLIAADCDPDKRDACESAFRTCDQPVKDARDKLHDMCRTQRETCEAGAADDQARHECHIAEQKCTLPVEPPEAVCHIDADECRWNAGDKMDPPPPPPPPAAGAMAPPPPPADGMMPPPPPNESPALKACRETEQACVESKRMKPEDLPQVPHCEPPPPPACAP